VIISLTAVGAGLVLLVFGADRFVTSSVEIARRVGMSPLLIGIILVGFGTSAPELLVSAISSVQGAPGIAIGNAWGSNIANIALILGITALLKPVMVQSGVLRRELPILAGVTLLATLQVLDGAVGRGDAVVLLILFLVVIAWSVRQNNRDTGDALATEVEEAIAGPTKVSRLSVTRLAGRTVLALPVLVGASRVLVWGAVSIARVLGIDDMIIGLTVVAVGTSLPELASSIAAARKGENDIAVGNIIGSNLFNTTAVVGIAGVIAPIPTGYQSLLRDLPVMAGLTMLLFLLGAGFRGRPGRINRLEGAFLVLIWLGYTAVLAGFPF
jgi:cation:H+ antiporter